jgi:hypothetical protein
MAAHSSGDELTGDQTAWHHVTASILLSGEMSVKRLCKPLCAFARLMKRYNRDLREAWETSK